MKKKVTIEFDLDSDEYNIDYGEDGISGEEFGVMLNCVINETIVNNIMPIQGVLYLLGDLVGAMVDHQEELQEDSTPMDDLLN